ncbi:MAG TPA: hypothetical protein ENJ52_02285 [Aliiroseovarius sp.]|nr:hypothetical protein [Aliiroseovarius sp.]
MANVKRTFTLPDEISEELDAAIPSRERSKFIALTLKEALRKKKQDELMRLLDDLPRKREPDGILAEDVLRDIRDGRAQEILDNGQS